MEEKEKKNLCHKYYFHMILFCCLFGIHIIIYLFTLYWIEIIKKLFFYISLIQIIFILYPIIPLILIYKKCFKKKINYFKIISNIFLTLSILMGLFFSVVIIINSLEVKKYCKECPFNLSFGIFKLNFNEYFAEDQDYYKLKKKCRERRCILNEYKEEELYPYSYLCNFDSEEEFGQKMGTPYIRILPNQTELKVYRQADCSLLEPLYRNLYFRDDIIYNYLDVCYYLVDFYICDRFQEPKEYNIEENKKCPEKNYSFYMIFLCFYIIIVDFSASIIPWCIEKKSYKELSSLDFEKNNEKKNINENVNYNRNTSNNQNTINTNTPHTPNNNTGYVSPEHNSKKIENSLKTKNTSNNEEEEEKTTPPQTNTNFIFPKSLIEKEEDKKSKNLNQNENSENNKNNKEIDDKKRDILTINKNRNENNTEENNTDRNEASKNFLKKNSTIGENIEFLNKLNIKSNHNCDVKK